MIKSKITYIGPKAVDEKDQMLILFDASAGKELRAVSVIQEFEGPKDYDLAVGKQVVIGSKAYKITYLGDMVASNLLEIGHTVLQFKAVPDSPQHNAGYLEPQELPDLELGMEVTFG